MNYGTNYGKKVLKSVTRCHWVCQFLWLGKYLYGSAIENLSLCSVSEKCLILAF